MEEPENKEGGHSFARLKKKKTRSCQTHFSLREKNPHEKKTRYLKQSRRNIGKGIFAGIRGKSCLLLRPTM